LPAYVVDTYAWIDYFRGVSSEKLKTIIDTGGNITPTIVLAELKRKYVAEGLVNFTGDLDYIKRKSDIIELDENTAILAGEIRGAGPPQIGMGLVDCILLAFARTRGSKVLTGDKHFLGLPETELI
jgi:predicted nucleic acid-binding protein